MGSLTNTYGFGTFVNVDVKVVETDTNTIKKHITKHNKATRNMVCGLLRFLEGRFSGTYANSKAEYPDDAKNYIPCYISFGDGGIQYDDNGDPIVETTTSAHIPSLASGWNTTVDYRAESLVHELPLLPSSRSKIRKQEDTFLLGNAPAGDMDTVVLYCEVAPGEINADIVNANGRPAPRFITEIGLFSSPYSKEHDLLAYVKLGNNEDNTDTETLYVRPGDTVIITWYITIVAMSDVSVVDSSEELLEPTLGDIEIEIQDPENDSSEE